MKKRCQTVEIMQRYLAGDATLVREIEANARSNHPIAQMFRASMGPTVVVGDDTEHSSKRRRLMEEKQIQKMNLDIEEQQLVVKNKQLVNEKEQLMVEGEQMVVKNWQIVNENNQLLIDHRNLVNIIKINEAQKLHAEYQVTQLIAEEKTLTNTAKTNEAQKLAMEIWKTKQALWYEGEEKQLVIDGLAFTNQIKEEEARKIATETLKIEQEIEKENREKEILFLQDEKTRLIKYQGTYIKGDVYTYANQYMSGVANSAAFLQYNCGYKTYAGGKGSIVNLDGRGFLDQFKHFLDLNHSSRILRAGYDFFAVITHYGGVKHIETGKRSKGRYEIDCDVLRKWLQDANVYDADYTL